MAQRRFPDTAYNAITIIGAALAGVCLATIAFLTGVELLHKRPPPYIGILSYVIVPVPLLLAALLLFAGVTTVFPLFTAYGSDRIFQWTESVGFCGTTACNGEGPLEGWH